MQAFRMYNARYNKMVVYLFILVALLSAFTVLLVVCNFVQQTIGLGYLYTALVRNQLLLCCICFDSDNTACLFLLIKIM